MQSPPVDFDTQQFFDTHIAEVDFTSEMIEKRKLARFIGRFEECRLQPELFCKAIGKGFSEIAVVVKEAYALRAFTRLYDQL